MTEFTDDELCMIVLHVGNGSIGSHDEALYNKVADEIERRHKVKLEESE